MNILIVDDHSLFRAGLSLVLQELDDNLHVFEASGIAEARHRVCDGELDLVLLDLHMPDGHGMELMHFLATDYSHIPVVVISASREAKDVNHALDCGAMGFIGKHMSSRVMISALRLVLSGEIYIPSFAMGASEAGHLQLTPRQKDVLELISQGLPNKTIAKQLNISEGTVKMHVTAIFRALDVDNRTQAVLAARKLGR